VLLYSIQDLGIPPKGGCERDYVISSGDTGGENGFFAPKSVSPIINEIYSNSDLSNYDPNSYYLLRLGLVWGDSLVAEYEEALAEGEIEEDDT
jgi:hypothetical protein